MKMIVYHLSRDLAEAKGLAPRGETRGLFEEAGFGHNDERHREAVRLLLQAGCYAPVAIVDYKGEVNTKEQMSSALEAAFEYTNHIDSRWDEVAHPRGVRPLNNKVRSTSVGDLVETIDNHCSKFWRVAPFGFKPLGDWTTIKEVA
jgi:hypothetical protein